MLNLTQSFRVLFSFLIALLPIFAFATVATDSTVVPAPVFATTTASQFILAHGLSKGINSNNGSPTQVPNITTNLVCPPSMTPDLYTAANQTGKNGSNLSYNFQITCTFLANPNPHNYSMQCWAFNNVSGAGNYGSVDISWIIFCT